MSSSHGTLFVVGSGPGIGSNVAKVFAERGFKQVILASRNGERLSKEVEEVKAAASGVKVDAVTMDLGDKISIKQALEQADKHLSGNVLEAVLFNAARVGPSKLLEHTPEQIESDIHVRLSSDQTIPTCS